MTLETEMQHEIERLEKELAQIDEELKKLQTKVVNLINIRKKREHDLRVLKGNFDDVDLQRDLKQLLKI